MRPIHSIIVPDGPRLCVSDYETARATHASYDVVVSILGPDIAVPWTHPRHYRFWVEDLERPGANAPDPQFLDNLLSLDLAGARTVLFHCVGGYSRSPAAAMLWAKRLGAPLKAIEQGIDWRRADPNRLILFLGEARLGPGPSLLALAARRTGRRNP